MNASHSCQFDKVAHLGIFEQVGGRDIAEYLCWLKKLVVPGGLVLLHRLTISPDAATSITLLPADFLSDGISRELQLAEKAGFSLVHAESLQSEYQETLLVWIENLLDGRRCAATRLFTSGYRAWMLYLIKIAKCLDIGEAQVHSVLLKRRA